MQIEKLQKPNPQEILEFLHKVDQAFSPPLHEIVTLDEYAKKICTLAELVVAREKEHLWGISAIYCNDAGTKTAFLTLLVVDKKRRQKGLASTMLNESFSIAKSKGMIKVALKVHKKNIPALQFYKKFGFEADINKKDVNPENICLVHYLDSDMKQE